MAVNKIIYNGQDYSKFTPEEKSNIIEVGFLQSDGWGPFIVEDDNISQINTDNGEQLILGDSLTTGSTIVVQGMKMFLNDVIVPADIDSNETTRNNYINHIKSHLYTKWHWQNVKSFKDPDLPNGAPYFTMPLQTDIYFKHYITSYDGNFLQYELYESPDDDVYTVLGNLWTKKYFSTTGTNAGWTFAHMGHLNSYCPYSYVKGNLTSPKYYGSYFKAISINQSPTENAPYGWVRVQPVWLILNDTTGAPNYAYYEDNAWPGDSIWTGKTWEITQKNSSYYSDSYNSAVFFDVPFGSEAELNYAIGISEKYRRITAEEYHQMTNIDVPTPADINQHYNDLNPEEEDNGENND